MSDSFLVNQFALNGLFHSSKLLYLQNAPSNVPTESLIYSSELTHPKLSHLVCCIICCIKSVPPKWYRLSYVVLN